MAKKAAEKAAVLNYAIKKAIPSIFVGKELLRQLEDFIRGKALVLEAMAKKPLGTAYTNVQQYTATLEDKNGGILKAVTVDAFPSPIPNDTHEIILDLTPYLHRCSIRVRFSTDFHFTSIPSTYYEISYEGPDARETVAGIESEILRFLEPHRKRLPRKPGSVLLFLGLVAPWLGGLAFGISTGLRRPELGIVLAVVCLLIFFLILACLWLPYSVFETSDNKSLLSRWEWLVRGLAGFILFTVICGTAWAFFKEQLSKLFTHP